MPQIPLIFLFEGLALPTAEVAAAASRVLVHVSILVYNFGFIPLIVLGVTSLVPPPALLRDGFFALAAVPTTTSMCVMHSTAAGGNAPLAAFAALLANVCAVGVTPAILGWACATAGVDYMALTLGIAGKMALPLVLGQLLRRLSRVMDLLASHAAAVALINRGLILALLIQILSDIIYWGGRISAPTLAIVVPTVIGLHLLTFGIAWSVLSAACAATTRDRIAVTYAASHKTVVLGLPLLRAAFADRPPEDRAIILLPLICYHVFTLLFGLAIAPRLSAVVALAAPTKAGVMM